MKNMLLPTIVLAILIGGGLKYAIPNQTNYVRVTFHSVSNNGDNGKGEDNSSEPIHRSPEPQADADGGLILGEETVRADVAKMVDYIWLAETSRGENKDPSALHNWCKRQGKSNEYGYGGMQGKICFKDHAEATAKVTDWIERHLVKFDDDVAKTLCYYNLGLEEINCKYYQKFIGGKI